MSDHDMTGERRSKQHETSRAIQAYEDLKDQILTGRLAPGTMLSTYQLAEGSSMSRTPIQEALKLLNAEGLVHTIPKVGFEVTRVTLYDVQEIYQLRLALEPLAVDVGMRRADPDALAAFRQRWAGPKLAIRPEDEPTPSADDYHWLRQTMRTHDEFHLSVAGLSGSRRLVEAIRSLLEESHRLILMFTVRRSDIETKDWSATPPEHQRIVDAVLSGDRSGAIEAMNAHVGSAQRAIMEAVLPEPVPYVVDSDVAGGSPGGET
ncbi:MAG: GntR family transcriptional regulator [Candidatus Dormibacteria bacterium]